MSLTGNVLVSFVSSYNKFLCDTHVLAAPQKLLQETFQPVTIALTALRSALHPNYYKELGKVEREWAYLTATLNRALPLSSEVVRKLVQKIEKDSRKLEDAIKNVPQQRLMTTAEILNCEYKNDLSSLIAKVEKCLSPEAKAFSAVNGAQIRSLQNLLCNILNEKYGQKAKRKLLHETNSFIYQESSLMRVYLVSLLLDDSSELTELQWFKALPANQLQQIKAFIKNWNENHIPFTEYDLFYLLAFRNKFLPESLEASLCQLVSSIKIEQNPDLVKGAFNKLLEHLRPFVNPQESLIEMYCEEYLATDNFSKALGYFQLLEDPASLAKVFASFMKKIDGLAEPKEDQLALLETLSKLSGQTAEVVVAASFLNYLKALPDQKAGVLTNGKKWLSTLETQFTRNSSITQEAVQSFLHYCLTNDIQLEKELFQDLYETGLPQSKHGLLLQGVAQIVCQSNSCSIATSRIQSIARMLQDKNEKTDLFTESCCSLATKGCNCKAEEELKSAIKDPVKVSHIERIRNSKQPTHLAINMNELRAFLGLARSYDQ